MSERFSSDLLFIIIVLVIAAILGFMIGYLIVMIQKRKAVQLLEKQIAGLETELSSCKKRRDESELEAIGLRKKLEEALAAAPEPELDPKKPKKKKGE